MPSDQEDSPLEEFVSISPTWGGTVGWAASAYPFVECTSVWPAGKYYGSITAISSRIILPHHAPLLPIEFPPSPTKTFVPSRAVAAIESTLMEDRPSLIRTMTNNIQSRFRDSLPAVIVKDLWNWMKNIAFMLVTKPTQNHDQ
jgi:hypothetical protein